MPPRLTHETGAKALLMGEFHEQLQIPNPDFCGCAETDCEDCENEEAETITVDVQVSWTTIKAIYAMAAEHFRQV